jgi:F-type H+-transporting ATPase subunit alpha
MSGKVGEQYLHRNLEAAESFLEKARQSSGTGLSIEEVGTVRSISSGVAMVSGLTEAGYEELISFHGDKLGMALDIDRTELGVVMLDEAGGIPAGSEVRRLGRSLDTPVGEGLLGRVVDGLGRPLDNKGPVSYSQRLPVERPAAAIMDRAPVTTPLQTGIKTIDAIIPVGRGQRELIVGDRQTGKTAIALDTIINQKGRDIVCIYCGLGKRGDAIAKVVDDLRSHSAMDYSIVVVSTADDPPGMQFIAAYAATAMGESFMEQGRDALVVYDDLTSHAKAYREISLLMRRPPGREAYPGDIFYIHSRLLERSTHLLDELGGGSLTALPIVETEAQNISGYIPTNLISITDGQIYLSPDLFQKGILPAIEISQSVSRVGGKTQLNAYREVVGDLKLSYSQFQELESFAKFGAKLDKETEKTLERGRRVREILKQAQYKPLPVCEQIVALIAVNQGVFDEVPTDEIAEMETHVRETVVGNISSICEKIESNQELTEEERARIAEEAADALKNG